MSKLLYIELLLALCCAACSPDQAKRFRIVPSSESGIHFRNELTETAEFNIFNYLYFYNGGGVAVGDVNGDSLPDIYFTSNQESNKLYINQGKFRFADATQTSRTAGFKGWTTGVTMADVNSDGKLDIYVSYLGDNVYHNGKNQLFINEGNDADGMPLFTDRAREFGLDLKGYATQAAFFDYDRDGDLDMFMLNHSVHKNGTFAKATLRKTTHPLAGDKLLRNDNGNFVDVTASSGIYSSALGYGLGVVVSDVNLDGWPDIYVGNDFHENDYLYINQGDGTFTESLEKQFAHTSRYTMGVDFADFNNDAFPDLMAADMLPEDPETLKTSMAEDSYDVYNFKINFGYNHQFARNTMQLNNHNGTFSDIALLAGVSATDWSWATLFADFDLDGHKDIFISNGIYRRSNDLDYINFISADSIQVRMAQGQGERELDYLEKMPSIRVSNYLYRNNGDSTFTNKANAWGLDEMSFSQGAAYADLDNDGDLDLVMNNINDEAFVYENLTLDRDEHKTPVNHFIRFLLNGKSGNTFGTGAKVFIYHNGFMQMQECMPTRGYQSAVDHRLTFGLGNASVIDSVLVIWSDGTFQKLKSVNADRQIVLEQQLATGTFDYSVFHMVETLFRRTTDQLLLSYRHRENSFVEFNREALMPHMVSAEGPAVAIGDINGDDLEDIYLSGAKRFSDQVFVQTADGKFREIVQSIFRRDSTYEDMDAILFDADNDSDNDLLLIPGGNEFSGKSKYRRPRLHLNDGQGNFSDSDLMPEIYLNGSCASLADVDGDGDLDIFIGARSVPWHYGVKPDSYLLLNDGNGKFTDATATIASSLKELALVKDAAWTDIDHDGDPDLIVAAEWSPVIILLNTGGNLSRMQLDGTGLEHTSGWWNTVIPADVDGDGDMDLIAGNMGLNSKLKTSLTEPVRMIVADIDGNDSTDQILSHYIQGQEYTFHTRDEMVRQLPFLKKKFLSYSKFASATLHDLLPENKYDVTERYEAATFESVIIENRGGLKFRVSPLPLAAQFSTVNSILADDFNGDQKMDILVAGNFYPVNIQLGRNDASYGLLLNGNDNTRFTAVPAFKSGFSVRGEVKHLRRIRIGNRNHIMAIRNSDSVEVFATEETVPASLAMK